MHQRAQGGAAPVQHLPEPVSDDLSWDDVRVFLGCVDSGSFRKAGDRLGLNASTVARRIDGIERRLGYPLFARVKDGLVITPEGKNLTSAARTMERSFYDLLRKMQEPQSSHRGLVKMSITDGLGTFWVMPLLVEFGRQNPNLIVEINCGVDSADVLRLEADLAIQFVRPDDLDLKMVRLGKLHVYPFASKAYADRYGLPKRVEDMIHHRLIDQVGPQMVDGAWARALSLPSVEGIVGIRSNASSAVFYAVEKGGGIGALPTFACALEAPVVPVDLGIHHSMDIWLTYHPDVRSSRRVSHVIDWARSIFDPARYPWFRDEFIHPRELVGMAPPGIELQSVKGSFAATPFRP